MCKEPLVINSWQVQIIPDDSRWDSLLNGMISAATTAGFLLPVLPEEDRLDELLWEISGQPAFAFASGCIASGFGQILIPSMMARLVGRGAVNPGDRGVVGEECRIALVERVKSFVEDNLQHEFGIKEIESHFHLSGRHLNRLFLKQFKVSIGRYMRESRMELGRRWLATTQRSVKDIALSLSYRSPSQFCRYFLQRFEMTPTEYRKKHHAEVVASTAISTSRRKSKKIHTPFLTR
jgi:AraC-like DNA-binding protein